MEQKTRSRISVWTLGAALTVGVLFFYSVRHILLPFVIAGGLAYVLTPLIRRVHARTGGPRWIVALAVYLMVVASLGGVVWTVGSKVYANAATLVQDAPNQLHQFLTGLFHGEQVTILGETFDARKLTVKIMDELPIHSPYTAAKLAAYGVGAAFGVILTLVLLFYFLLSGPQLTVGLLRLVPPEFRSGFQEFAAQANPLVQRYLIGLVVVVACTAFLTWIGVGPIFHLPHPVFLAIATGVLELIPIVGPTASACLLGYTAVMQGGNAWTFAGFALFCLCLRLLIDQVIGPLVLGQAVRIPAVVIIFAFLAGGVLLGVVGVLIAIPITAFLKLLLDRYYAIPSK